jgi:hypothetical protein
MHPITHFLVGWTVASAASLERRDRMVVTGASVIADIDGLGVLAELLTFHTDHPLNWYSEYHHALTHNVGFAILVGIGALFLARQRTITFFLSMVSFHLHLLGDLVGSRGPDGYQWPIPYLFPFSDAWKFTWAGQWELNAWPNFMITILLLGYTFYLAWRRGYSPIEIFSISADHSFVAALRKKVGYP